MIYTQAQLSPALHKPDETAWLERMAELARAGHADRLDPGNLADLANRDKREIENAGIRSSRRSSSIE